MAGLSLSLTVILVFSCHLVNCAPSLIPPAGTLVDNQQIVNTPVPDGQQPYGGNSGGGSAVFPQDISGIAIGFAKGNITAATTKLSLMINHINETAAAVWGVNDITNSDINSISTGDNLLDTTWVPTDGSDCGNRQTKIDTSISYIQCFSEHLSSILVNLTHQLLYNNSFKQPLFREHVYQAYEYVAVVNDMKKLAASFPCSYTPPTSKPVTCTPFENIKVNHKYLSCSTSLCSSMTYAQLEMVVVISKIASFMDSTRNALKQYNDGCLVLKTPCKS